MQAEDEIAALGMVIGASWAGARAMTSTSGPGISLMGEFTGLGYYAEIPALIFDIQRVGPSTGLPTRLYVGCQSLWDGVNIPGFGTALLNAVRAKNVGSTRDHGRARL